MAKRKSKKRKNTKQPTERTLDWLRERGYMVDKTEHWIGNPFVPASRKRKDLFGCIDVVALHRKRRGVLGVQATSRSGVSARVTKSCTECRKALKLWLRSGNRFLVMGWFSRKEATTTKKAQKDHVIRWYPRLVEIQWSRKTKRLLVIKNVLGFANEDQ